MSKRIEELRRRKRDNMRRARSDPDRREKMNAARRGNSKYLAKGREYNATLKKRHFFKWRARLVNRCGVVATAKDLAAIWKAQRGRCALSGVKLDRAAHLDHIVPKSKGGRTELGNLRWLDPWANVALQNLTDDDFVARCNQVAEWIGRRIVESHETG